MKKLDEVLDMCPDFYDRESFANGYLKGYHQAEKNLELTWEDVSLLKSILFDVEHECFTNYSHEEFCKEVLKRFKEQKDV